ncbi:F-box only protein 30 [Oncorhynchus kisutch]|uniref:F-box protein 30a n=1 Tax=Oncorhynchus kisutch TaxID=8019 RepID=A0A8C7CJS0_ONCKI|nr:F-box only protein 30 [Oncorhynchus kisutch]XP_020343186.1 F-box only protein 30 [Oncorhynchus kisutch]
MEALHAHCMKCVNRRCMIRPETGVSCDLIGCPLVCGAVFHSCKVEEHHLLCPFERVPCLNTGFGCPFTIARLKMAEHLETCPASVVCCTMEWNRWPVSYSDRKSYEYLSNVEVVEQLDMALALQDQRMLLESLRVTTNTSNNGYNKPAVETNEKMADVVSSVPETAVSNRMVEMDEAAALTNGVIEMDDEESYISVHKKNLAATLDVLRSAKDVNLVNGIINGEKTERNGVLHNGENRDDDLKNVEMKESGTQLDCELGAVGGVSVDCGVGTGRQGDGSHWIELDELIKSSEEVEKDGMMGLAEVGRPPLSNGFHHTGDDHNHLRRRERMDLSRSPPRRSEVNRSSDFRPVMPYLSMPNIVAPREPSGPHPPPLPIHLPLPMPLPNLEPYNVLQHLPLEIEDRWLERKLQNLQVLRGMSVFTFNGRRAMMSDPYLFRAKMEDKSVDTSDLEVTDDPLGLHGIDLITAALLFCLGDSPGGRSISDSRFVDGYRVDFGTQTFSFPSAILATNTMVGDIASASACDHASPQLSNPSPFHTLRLDLVLECVARYQTKQRTMFTFVCGQLFRRDEFSSHFKNVHGDIHAGLNGWLEHRCPLAYYGCTYSQRRFCPSVQGSRIIHDRHLGSFGVQPGMPPRFGDKTLPRNACRFGSTCDHLSSLPFEVQQYVASFLDGFSLCQLSRVSRTMRDVCGSLLKSRGMVVLLWENTRRPDGSSSWQIQNKVWRFSTAFGTVNEWKFANIANMAEHLKKCKFNTITRRDEAIPLPCMCFTRELTKEGRSLRSVLKPVL